MQEKISGRMGKKECMYIGHSSADNVIVGFELDRAIESNNRDRHELKSCNGDSVDKRRKKSLF